MHIKALHNKVSMQYLRIIDCFICNISVLFTVLYAICRRRISRGCALAKTGSLDAARASLEEAAAMATQGNHMMLQIRAVEVLLAGPTRSRRFDCLAGNSQVDCVPEHVSS